ncbi:MAG: ABC transporter permease [Chloroflexi bacterium]|nr:ABC transporter permease [Chloroflexota bacterium]
MLQHVLSRLIAMVPVLIGVSIVTFASVRFLPGDPALVLAGEYASAEYVAQVRTELGLDQPIYVQYAIYVNNLLHGDLGYSIKAKRPVLELITSRYPASLQLAAASVLIATLIGLAAGIIAATRRNSIVDHASMLFSLLGFSMPIFWLGLVLMMVFAVTLRWLPAAGSGGPEYLILPAFTQGVVGAGLIARMTRSAMLDVLGQDFIRTARAKGLAELVVTTRHALRNALLPVITIIGLQSGYLLGGTVITEWVFAWPGMGRLIVDSIYTRDYPVVQGAILLFAFTFAVINLIVDLSYAALDPRIRYG